MKVFSITIAFLLSAKAMSAYLPKGTYPEHDTITVETNAGIKAKYTFTKDSSFQWYDFERGLSASGSVTCTCNSGSGGCNPDEAGNCYMTGCDTCTKTTTGVAIRRNDSVKLMETSGEVEANLPSTDGALFKLGIVATSIKKFNLEYGKFLVFDDNYCPDSKDTGVCKAKKGHAFVAVNVHGSTTYVPAKLDKNGRFHHRNLRLAGGVSLAKLSCSCKDGSCPMSSTWGHKYCDAANCQSCTMSGLSVAPVESVKRVRVRVDGIKNLP